MGSPESELAKTPLPDHRAKLRFPDATGSNKKLNTYRLVSDRSATISQFDWQRSSNLEPPESDFRRVSPIKR
jgi:hypothetical protein